MPRRTTTESAEPDLPIISMLEMTFQLLTFLLVAFKPLPAKPAGPTEDGVVLSFQPDSPPLGPNELPPINDGPLFWDGPPIKIIVSVYSTQAGAIEKMTVMLDLDWIISEREVGPNPAELHQTIRGLIAEELKRRHAPPGGIPRDIEFKIGGRLLQAHLLPLLDPTLLAEFDSVDLVLLDPTKR